LQGLGLSVPLLGRGWTQLDSKYWPVSLVNELKREPPETPIFNDMLFGGFVIAYAPHLRVFIDDRCELYGDAFIREYFEAERDDPARLEEWAKAYGFRHALVRSDSEQNPSAFDRYLHDAPGWEVVEQTPGATLYRRVPPTEK